MKIRTLSILIVVTLFALLALQTVNAQTTTHASTSGFGAAFGYAQTIGNISYVQTGGIGNADANAWAMTAVTSADSGIWTGGNAAGFSSALATPFGNQSFVQLASFFGGMASGSATASN